MPPGTAPQAKHNIIHINCSFTHRINTHTASKMGTKIEYVDTSHMHATNYIRNSKAIAVLWAIFTICYAIISAVAFLTPGMYATPKNTLLQLLSTKAPIHEHATISSSSSSSSFLMGAEWVGDLDSENAGRLGLWQVCQKMEMSDNCQRQLTDVLTIPSMPFQVGLRINRLESKLQSNTPQTRLRIDNSQPSPRSV